MKLLLTSNGVTNPTIERKLVELLGRPISEASALFVAIGMYPYAGGPYYATTAITGKMHALGWKAFGNLELAVLPSIDPDVWQPTIAAADAIVVWGGDPVFIAHWLRTSGVADAIAPDAVYVGTSAGSMAACTTIGEAYSEPRRARGDVRSTESIVLPDGNVSRTLVIGPGMGWVDVSIIPHFGAERHPDASPINAAHWAAKIPARTYAIDDATALAVVDGQVEVVTEGRWQLFTT